MTLGATLTTVKAPDRDGNVAVITLHKKSFAEYAKGHPLLGSVVGRFANRIADAKFTIDGVTHQVAKNAGKHHIHGGGRKDGFAWQVWQGQPIRDEQAVGVRLTLVSPDGQAGFPGRLETVVTYKLTVDNRLIMDYVATTDAPTHVNLTNHAYWNLVGADSEDDVSAHQFMLNADHFLPSDKTKMPTGEIRSVAGSAMDFTGSPHDRFASQGHRLRLLRSLLRAEQAGDERLSFCARVVEPKSGRVMTVHTTQPGVQLYTGNARGLCLETQHYPNAPNEPNFPSTLLPRRTASRGDNPSVQHRRLNSSTKPCCFTRHRLQKGFVAHEFMPTWPDETRSLALCRTSMRHMIVESSSKTTSARRTTLPTSIRRRSNNSTSHSKPGEKRIKEGDTMFRYFLSLALVFGLQAVSSGAEKSNHPVAHTECPHLRSRIIQQFVRRFNSKCDKRAYSSYVDLGELQRDVERFGVRAER